jgi:hypothetical protein
VVVTGVIVPGMAMRRMTIVVCHLTVCRVIVIMASVIVPGMVMALRMLVFVSVPRPLSAGIVGMGRVIVTERNAFESTWRTADHFGLTKGNIVRRLAFENEICRLLCRE